MAMFYNANSSFCNMEAEEKVWNYTIFFRSNCGNDGVDPYALSTLCIQAKETPMRATFFIHNRATTLYAAKICPILLKNEILGFIKFRDL